MVQPVRLLQKTFKRFGTGRTTVALVMSLIALGGISEAIAGEVEGISLSVPIALPQTIFSLKEQRSLHFNRTPEEALRPMSVGGSQTIDVGHVQVELDLASSEFERTDGGNITSTSVAPMTVRVGLAPHMDAALQWAPYNVEQSQGEAGMAVQQGRGDLVALLKFNLWGNEGESTGLAMMPYVKLPTASEGMGNSAMEMGVIVPLDLALPYEFALGVENDVALLRAEDSIGYQPSVATSFNLGHPIARDVVGYVTLDSEVAGLTKDDLSFNMGAGLTYNLSESMILDAGISTGVPDPGNAVSVAVSAAARF